MGRYCIDWYPSSPQHNPALLTHDIIHVTYITFNTQASCGVFTYNCSVLCVTTVPSKPTTRTGDNLVLGRGTVYFPTSGIRDLSLITESW